ncbi:MAG: DNA polymerase Y family protein [Chloroflexi bacterium]|nr:DNA polymerase Y family protein [Chloroflexota bacterium]MCI0780960.1 DNA polymerase Y family protein [Chloroflexota bacterium]MCI0799544.1 DNA polymerase Y family protein [Chloroflexota bacterium]MCI0823276.1 DNA polymerase Y family protein [Chloroflexota bacterium]MCI0858940.1 DNA polymerase Y family protein [Chloroflexota bacterium]
MLIANMKIACVLITHLPLKAELRRHPELVGRPVVITESYGSKQVVLDSAPEARGVIAGMPLQEAVSRCKDTLLLQADEPYYDSVFDEMAVSLEGRSPLVEKAQLGCAYVGLDGLEAMYDGEARLITSLLQAVPHQFNPRVGVALGKFPAYVAAVTSSGGRATKVPEDVAGFLKELSVDLLPLSWDNKTRLHRFGLHTLGQLAALSVGSLQAQLRSEGRRAWELASGVDPSPLVPCRREEVVTEFLTFPSPTITRDAVLTAMEILLARAFTRPEISGKYVRTAVIESRLAGQKPPWIRRFGFKEALGSKERAIFAMKSRLGAVLLPGPLEDMKLTLSGITGESGIQSSLFSDVRKREQLREMMRQLQALLGCKPPIYQMKDVEPWSRIPERRQALVPFDP